MLQTTQQKLHAIFSRSQLTHYGWTKLQRPLTMDLYLEWISEGQHLDMEYLQNHQKQKENPKAYSKAVSALVLAIPYLPHPWPTETTFKNPIALYARGRDYHQEIPKLLKPFLADLQEQFADDQFNLYTDSAPILERDLAYRAGLGWFGKNTCLIDQKKGSLFLLAEIVTTLNLDNESPWQPDFCGTCNKCIEACPTQALTNDRKLMPSRCISYWTIEAKALPPEYLRSSFGSWLFGCDICQTVCPWNQKHLRDRVQAMKPPSNAERIAELKWILTASRKSLARDLQETPLARAAGWKLQRNAIIVATNNNFVELVPFIEAWAGDSKLAELVAWSLTSLR
jgi:epoxyqueuosine reductase